MSYDLLAFSPDSVADANFPAWWDQQSTWPENHSYDDPAVTTGALRAMYDELIQTYPPMNGPDAPTNELIENDPALEARLTDYSIGSNLIYAAFAWSQAINAKSVFLQVANKHGVAVAAISDDGQITRPDAPDAVNQPRKTFWRRK